MKNNWVYTNQDHGWINVDKTEFLDIEESPYGDIMYFEYNGEMFFSKIAIGSKPGN
jgi:hypothetical protein